MPSRCNVHTWTTRVDVMRELQKDGWPTGYWQVEVSRLCDCCPAVEVERVPGARAKSAQAALAIYERMAVTV